MPRNGSGTYTPSENFTTEAASPPIEISTLDDAFSDVGDEITNSVAADGQTPMTGNLNLNSNKVVNLANPTANGDAVNLTTAETRYRRLRQNEQNGSYTCVLDDDGKHIYKSSGGAGETITIPANASVAYELGATLTFINQGGGDLTIAITSDTLTHAVTGETGSRTLADDGIAVAIKVTSTSWIINGPGLS